MTFIHIKKIQTSGPQGVKDVYAVPCMVIATPQGRKLIPNPSGSEADLFDTLEEAEEAVRRAGFDYVFEGKRTYTMSQGGSPPAPAMAASGSSLDQAVPLLIRHLQDRESSVVANSVYALGALRANAALASLVDALGHDDPGVRKSVAEAMARLGAGALPALQDAYQAARTSTHKNAPYIRLTVMSAFLEMLQIGAGTPVIERFMPLAVMALEDESWLVRAQAALVIGRAAEALEQAKAQK